VTYLNPVAPGEAWTFQVETSGVSMNKDQVKGATKDAAGKVQEAAGKLVGSKEQQAKGLVKQAEGSTQKNYGDLKEDVKDATKR
jgi:uncharacterized protein YjbJ (UPF0337 family)